MNQARAIPSKPQAIDLRHWRETGVTHVDPTGVVYLERWIRDAS